MGLWFWVDFLEGNVRFLIFVGFFLRFICNSFFGRGDEDEVLV